MIDIEAELGCLFSNRSSGPFLFMGSGFSRRYIELEDWHGLLKKFCVNNKPFNYYKSSSGNNTPLAAKLIADDFHDFWWESEDYAESRIAYSDKINDKTSPLRYAICEYLMGKQLSNDLNLKDEITALRKCDVDGIITTNWDTLIESIFPEYKVYVGQKELLFSNTLNICEIYKIHGCCSDPESLVLTDDDYSDFNGRNAYLAAKLITIFVEHPVVFLGYSISDENIRDLLKSISLCIGGENISKLQDNLIFIDRNEDVSGPSIHTSYIQFDSVQIPIKIVKIKDFTSVYNAVNKFKRRLPAKVLRFCKEQVYEVVRGQVTDKKIAVVDYDSVDDKSDFEVVFGIGIIDKVSDLGYSSFKQDDIFEHFIFDNKDYKSLKLLKLSIEKSTSKYLPIYKFLRDAGINSLSEYKKSDIDVDRFIESSIINMSGKLPLKYKDYTYSDFIVSATNSEIIRLSLFFKDVDLIFIEQFIKDNFAIEINSKLKYGFRKLIVHYDYLKYKI